VFLSYASQDAEAAGRICEALRAADVEVWFDQSELRGGDAWDEKIRREIRDCALFIPIISRNTQARPEGYFRLEWRLADQRTHLMGKSRAFLVPVCVDDTRDADADIPDSFAAVQWTRLPGGETPPTFSARIDALLSASVVSSGATSAPVAPSTQVDAAAAKTTPRMRLVAIGVSILILVGLPYVVIERSRLARRTPVDHSVAAVAPAPAAQAIPEKSVAVLPFVDMSEKHDQEYFADGMAEEIIDLLVKVPGLKIIGRTSSFRFKGNTEDLRSIGAQLGAAYLLEGSVRKSGDRLRVTAQLINSRDGTHLFSQTYDREFSDILKMQDEIAASLVRALQIEVSETVIASRPVLQSTQAYSLYLQGLHAKDRFDEQGLEQAVSDFQQSLDLDPSFAAAAGGLANVYYLLGQFGFMPPSVAFEKARDAAQRALSLDPKLAATHALLGNIYIAYDWDWVAASREIGMALDVAPNDAYVLFIAAVQAQVVGRLDDALKLINASLAQDPLNPSSYLILNFVQVRRGRLAEAEAALRRALEISPTFAYAHYGLGIVLLARNDPQSALAEMLKEDDEGARLAGSAMAYIALAHKAEADAALAQVQKNPANRSFKIASVYAFRGESDEAFKWLEHAYAERDPFLCSIKGDPTMKKLEGDPRYTALLRKMNLPN
jgi:TolB-like protein/cytochrome c-type biogenesis protein CcmH/NrfG